MTSGTMPAAALLQHAHRRTEQLQAMAMRFRAQAARDPTGPDALRHAACITALAAQCAHLHEVSGLADSAGLHDVASAVDTLIDDAWASINSLAHEVRMASIGCAEPAGAGAAR